MAFDIIGLDRLEAGLMRQVDRSEVVKYIYQPLPSAGGLGLVLERVDQDPPLKIPAWGEAGIQKRIRSWQPELEAGGSMLAAVDGEKVAGFGIIGPGRPDGSVELCALFVGADSRHSGVGTALFERLEALAKTAGAQSLLVYGNPTASSVDFYRKMGCEIIGLADKRLVSHLPWDVVFAKPL